MLLFFRRIREKYREQTLVAFAIISTVVLILSEIIPSLRHFLSEASVIEYATLLLVIDVALALHSLRRQSQPLRVHSSQADSAAELSAVASQCRGETVDLLEFAGMNALQLIRALRASEANIRMLMKHPDSVVGAQRDRAMDMILLLQLTLFVDYKGSFKLRCYRAPYSLRGRRLGDRLLELGWLTPSGDPEFVHGYDNPSILLDPMERSSAALVDFFSRSFEELWSDSETLDAVAVLREYQDGWTHHRLRANPDVTAE